MPARPLRLTCVLAALAAVLALAAPARAALQDGPPTLEEVAARITELGQDAGLEEAKRSELVQRWRAVQALLEAAAAHRAQVAAWQAEEAEARGPAEGTPPGIPTLPDELPEGADRPALEAALGEAQQLSADAEARLAEINARQTARTKRKGELAPELTEARAALEAARASAAEARATETTQAQADPSAAAAPAALREAALREAERRARVAELEGRVARLEAESAGFDLRGERLERRARAWAVLKQEAARRRAKLEAGVQAAREREARKAEADAREQARAVASQHVVLEAIAERNDALSRRRSELLDRSRELQVEVTTAREDLEALEARMAATKSRDELARGTEQVGSVLRKERQKLPDLRDLEQRLVRYARELTELRLLEFDLSERQKELRLPGEALARDAAEVEGAPPLDEVAREEALKLLDVQGKLLGEALGELARTTEYLAQIEGLEARLFTSAEEYKAFIDERVLWVRSTDPLWALDLRALGRALGHYANPGNWTEVPVALADAAWKGLGGTVLYALALVALLAARPWLRRRDAVSDPAVRSTNIRPTFAALGRDAFAAAAWPVIAAGPAWIVRDADLEAAPLARAIADGVLGVLPAALLFTILRRVARAGGTGELYFGWGQANTKLLRRAVMVGGPLYLAPLFVASVVQESGQQAWSDTLGRLGFLAAMAALVVMLRWLVGESGLTTPARYRDEESWVARLRPLWNLLGVGGAAALLGLSALGFDYTARTLHVPFGRSLALMLLVLVVQAIAFRWLLLARRRIQVEQARARREAEDEAKALEAEELPDLRVLGVELRRTVRAATAILTIVGLYWLWRNEIPALGALDRIRLYPLRAPGDGEFVFTASKLLVVLVAVFTTGAVARRLPGLLDFLLLDRTNLTAAERYAVRSIVQYVVVALGVLVALAQVGITWSQLQWLAAAVSVGLGFGLQEIFANFVSGLILLFERPVRVGDLVSINGMEGRVTNIRIRATTILDYDRRELIVPNKEFVTGSLVNWTLSDPITRVTIPVGVGYGSDVALVHRLLLQAAGAVPVVLRDPQPHTVFRRFGESSLDFELRIFLGDRDHWLDAVNGTHERITALFREHGVEIPFPQRDVHLVDAAPLVETFGGPGRR